MTINSPLLSLHHSIGRWSGVGPYYAMFPVAFAFDVIAEFSKAGEGVLDPFAGRASSIYAAAAQDRYACGIEINPVGWLYGQVKLNPATHEDVEARVVEIGTKAKFVRDTIVDEMPEFFHCCYTPQVLRYLLAARRHLHWKTNQVDATVMAIILIHLHGKIQNSFSNQMRQSKAMSPQYSVRWWREHNSLPPVLNPVVFLQKRLQWRYAKGVHELPKGVVLRGDSRQALKKPIGALTSRDHPYTLLFTSPPYYAITDYHYDQWLRLWMLGGPPHPVHGGGDSRNRFQSQLHYCELLCSVFKSSAKILDDRAVIYVRTDARAFTNRTTREVLKQVFPDKTMEVCAKPFSKQTQTALYGDKEDKPGEADIILRPRHVQITVPMNFNT